MSFPRQRLPSLVSDGPARSNGEEPDPSSSEAHRTEGTYPMSRSTTSRTVPAILAAAVLLAAVAVAATGAFGRTVTPAPEPTDPPIVEPSTPPTAPPSAPPSEPPADGPTKVVLENLTGHDVSIEIDDQTGSIVRAQSGTPGDGMSVRWFDVKVENIDADTLRVVWVGLPRDEVIKLGVSTVDGKVRLRFVQDGPPLNSDATGHDRVLELSFDAPVRSEDVLTSVQESLDTQD
jgi:hypothetical protein